MLLGLALAASTEGADAAPKGTWWSIKVGIVTRKAFVYVGKSATTKPSPLVLAFHGMGGTGDGMAAQTKLHLAWPEATVAYCQAANTPNNPFPTTIPSWQPAPGAYGDYDLKFVDALVKTLRLSLRVDSLRIYATGHSNGAIFCYLLFATRPYTFAAFAPVAGMLSANGSAVNQAQTPRPFLVTHGTRDSVIPYRYGVAAAEAIRRVNQCDAITKPWTTTGYVVYPSQKTGVPVVWYAHKGGHEWPSTSSQNVAKFFQEHTLNDGLPLNVLP
jgi:polyhydroxybutyrate depolymerase